MTSSFLDNLGGKLSFYAFVDDAFQDSLAILKSQLIRSPLPLKRNHMGIPQSLNRGG